MAKGGRESSTETGGGGDILSDMTDSEPWMGKVREAPSLAVHLLPQVLRQCSPHLTPLLPTVVQCVMLILKRHQ